MDEPAGVQRAAVLIGVARTGGLPPLQAVAPGIERMTAWTRAQGFSSLTTITDDAGPVTVGQVQDAIDAVLAPGTATQLVVYFAGHGVNIGRAEYWLLSKAPGRPNEAVNVDASERLAQYCGVAHVVLISDCCRTAAAADTVFQSVSGTPVFPNEAPGRRRRPVDRFYACALGSPALEVRQAGADDYTAVYTATLADALDGDPDSLLERTDDGGVPVGLVRPWPLQEYLEGEVGRRLVRLTGSFDHTQVPDAVITSGPTAWLSRFDRPGRPPATRGPTAPPPPTGPTTPAAAARAAVREALDGEDERSRYSYGPPRGRFRPIPPGQARVVVRGTTMTAAESPVAAVEATRTDVTVNPGRRGWADRRPRTSADLLVRFGNGTCAVVPALASYTATLTFSDRELVELAWAGAPSGPSAGWVRSGADPGALARAVATAARLGALRLAPGDAQDLAARLVAGRLAPALAVQAAYLLADLQRDDLVETLAERYALELGVDLFDLALLTGRRYVARRPVVPAVPLLARGWALLDTVDLDLPAGVAGLRRHLLPSIWTLFDDAAVPEVRDVLLSGRNR